MGILRMGQDGTLRGVRMNFLSAALLLLCMAYGSAQAQADDTVFEIRAGHSGRQSLSPHLYLLEDPSGTLMIDDVRKPEVAVRFMANPKPTQDPNLGFTDSAIWLRFTLRNGTSASVEQLIEWASGYREAVTLYSPDAAGAYRSSVAGTARPFASRPYPSRFPVFPVVLAAGQTQTFYLRVHDPVAALMPVALWDAASYADLEHRTSVIHALYFGMVMALVLFNALLFLILRAPIYLWYVGFVLSSAFYQAAVHGIGHQILWPDAPAFAIRAVWVSVWLAITVAFQFTRKMLNTATIVPRLDTLLRVGTVGCLVLLLLAIFHSSAAVIQVMSALVLLSSPFVLVAALVCAFQRQRSAYFFLAAFVPLIIAIMLERLAAYGAISQSAATLHAIQFGSAFEMVMLSLALADRFAQLKKEKEKAQDDMLKAQEATVIAQAEKNLALTQLVTNVAHEINTPLGAIRSSGANIDAAISESLAVLPDVIQSLEADHYKLFKELIESGSHPSARLTSREERQIRRALIARLEHAGIPDPYPKAVALIQLAAHTDPTRYSALLRHKDSDEILRCAQTFASISVSSGNIGHAVERVSKTVSTLKSFIRDKGVSALVDLDLTACIDKALSQYEGYFKQSVVLQRDYTPVPSFKTIPEVADVWLHLIHNAMQGMAYCGQLAISVSGKAHGIEVTIKDTGSGISPEVQLRMFEPFFGTRPQGEGAGLGLYVVKKTLAKANGSIHIDSEEGKGTCVTVFLPLPPSFPPGTGILNSRRSPAAPVRVL